MRIKVTADSTCDLPQTLLDKYDIGITPLSIVKGNVPYKDGIEIHPQDIFDHVESGAGICHTTAVNTAEYIDAFSGYLENYDAIVHVNIGSKFSACNQNANIAAKELENVYVIDSENLSCGNGQIALDAAMMAQAGVSPGEITLELTEKSKKAEMSFVINTVNYLYKGGRCSALAALGANILGLKPCIEVNDGLMDVGKKYRGPLDKALQKYIKDRLADRDDIDYTSAFLVHSGVSDEILDMARGLIAEYSDFKVIHEAIAGCTISCHCGPNTLGIMFYRK